MDCEHHIRETRRGAGHCQISYEVLKRSGQPNWWCRTHGMEASAPDGAALERCPGAWYDPVPQDLQLEIALADGEFALWGALPPAISIGDVPAETGKVHVHHRPNASREKDIDRSFDIVRVTSGENSLVVEGIAAVAFSISQLAGVTVVPLACPRCGEMHIDELKFATHPHHKHQCNTCGRNFNDRSGRSVANPLADAHATLGLVPQPDALRVTRPLDIDRLDFAGIAVWPSNAAIVSTMTRPEDLGIHVHAWSATGECVIDDTFSPVTIDGVPIDEDALRALCVQLSLAHGAPIISLNCHNCGQGLTSPHDGWIEPRTSHTCRSCGAVMRTPRRVFLNPLAEKIAGL